MFHCQPFWCRSWSPGEGPVEEGGEFGDDLGEEVLVGPGCAVGAVEGDDAGVEAAGGVLIRLGDPVGCEQRGGGVVEGDWFFVFDVAGDQVVAAG